jgi:hypothetical protein
MPLSSLKKLLADQTEVEQAGDQVGEDNADDKDKPKRKESRRWATRTEALSYGKFGSTKLNELMQDRKILAKKDGTKVKIDLDTIDDYIDSLSDVAAATAHNA